MTPTTRPRHVGLAAPRLVGLALALALVLLIGFDLAMGAQGQDMEDPRFEPIPDLAGDLADPAKSMMVRLAFNGRTDVAFQSAEIVHGPTRSRLGDPGLLRAEVVDHKGAVVDRFHPWNPRWAFSVDQQGRESKILLPKATGNFVFPFSANVATLRVFDRELNDQLLIEAPLDPTVRAFCEANPAEQQCQSDLTLAKADSPDPVAAGTVLTYTLTAGNNGPGRAWDGRVIDTLPPGVTFEGASPGCTLTGGRTVTCEVGALSPGDVRTLQITVVVDPGRALGGGALVNAATFDSPTLQDPNTANSSAQSSTEVVEIADMAVTKVGPAEPVPAGTPVTYTVRASNDGPSTASQVRVVDTLPGGVAYQSSSAPCVESPAGRLTCSVGAIPVGEVRELSITGTVDSDLVHARGAAGSVTITNNATVENAGGTDPDGTDDTASADTVVIEVADVAVSKVGPAEPVPAGTPVTYTVRASNDGPSTASQVRVVD
ncbi:MAG: DUF11 domain-containing protein, partial [Actinomycetota bacterium]|nr:DUF11 domain-containing protein [Actinomycetota bacterium]